MHCSKCCVAAVSIKETEMIVEMQEYVAERGELLRGQMRKGPVPATADSLYEALGPEHEIIEP